MGHDRGRKRQNAELGPDRNILATPFLHRGCTASHTWRQRVPGGAPHRSHSLTVTKSVLPPRRNFRESLSIDSSFSDSLSQPTTFTCITGQRKKSKIFSFIVHRFWDLFHAAKLRNFFHSCRGCCILLRIVAYCCFMRYPTPQLLGMPFPSQTQNFTPFQPRLLCLCDDTFPFPVPVGNGLAVAATTIANYCFCYTCTKPKESQRPHRKADEGKDIPADVDRSKPSHSGHERTDGRKMPFFRVADLRVLCQWLASG